MNDKRTDITPATKIKALLDAYPQLEDTLIRLSPVFSKLKNPILRKTVARVATLQQVAEAGNVSLAELINTLRREVGISDEFTEQEVSDGQGRPSWFRPDKIKKTLDARPLLEQGIHPVGQVLQDLDEFGSGEIYELITGFVPSPLIDKVKERGFDAWILQEGPELVKSYFCRK